MSESTINEQNKLIIRDKIIGKFIIHAQITNTSNLLIASGDDFQYNYELVREDGNIFIPGSTLAGCIQAYMREKINSLKGSYDLSAYLDYLWGSESTHSTIESQSHIIIEDAHLVDIQDMNKINVRDGVKINPTSGIAEDGAYYRYELLEPLARFQLNMEVTVREGIDPEIVKELICILLKEGEKGEYSIGAFQNHDFGKIKFDLINVWEFNFSKPDVFDSWYAYISEGKLDSETKLEFTSDFKHFEFIQTNYPSIEVLFKLSSSLLIGSSNKAMLENNVDVVHLNNKNDEAIISAKSLRGVMKHRANKIMQLMNPAVKETLINSIFGVSTEEKNRNRKTKKQDGQKGALLIEEIKLGKPTNTQIQTRNQIDRFTGGTMPTALFSAQPLWNEGQSIELKLILKKIDNYEKELGLLLLVLKDMISGNLAVGGNKSIGRGVLHGQDIDLKIGSETYTLSFDVSDNPDKWPVKNISEQKTKDAIAKFNALVKAVISQ